jgi:phosphoenolpyruvate carboxykinase (ATP)
MHTMLIRPTRVELANFGEPDFTIYNAGSFPPNRLTTGMGSTTSIDLSLERCELVILGTEYAGEMKKGVFTVANYFAPRRGILSMHCSATADKETGRSSLLFGLSGTGKTTLSADPKRHLIGDDEHCWTEDGIFNTEGGCYDKAINLTPENEPDNFQSAALRRSAGKRGAGRRPFRGLQDTSITENARGAYPIEFIYSAKIPCIAGHPVEVIFLTCDASAFYRHSAPSPLNTRCITSSALDGQSRRHGNGRYRTTGYVLTVSSAAPSWCGIRTNTPNSSRLN